MKDHYLISYSDIFLRSIRRKDIENIRKLRNVNRFFFIQSELISFEQQKKWYFDYLNKNDDLMFAIESEEKAFLGTIALYHINNENHTAEFGRIMAKKMNTPKHIGTKAIIGLLIFAKDVFHLVEVYCYVLKDNVVARQIYERIGFVPSFEKDNIVFYKIYLKEFDSSSLNFTNFTD